LANLSKPLSNNYLLRWHAGMPIAPAAERGIGCKRLKRKGLNFFWIFEISGDRHHGPHAIRETLMDWHARIATSRANRQAD